MELNKKWKNLQNGSDIRGVSIASDPERPVNLDDEVAGKIAAAFIEWLNEKTGKDSFRIGVGTDSRLSGPGLKNAVLKVFQAEGSIAIDCNMASTPAMFMSCVFEETGFDAGIMITASHLPSNRNGMKFFTPEGGLEKKDITRILEIAMSNEESPRNKKSSDKKLRKIENFDLISLYSSKLTEIIRKGANSKASFEKPLEGLRIVVDAGNGAGGFFADKVLLPLGADVEGSQFLEPDGNFPNHIPNPEDKEAMESIRSSVLKNKADFGIIFDTDVDRAGAVDKNGNEINRNSLIALMSAIILEEHPGTTIVTDSITSSELKIFIEEKLKGKHHRFKRGYKNVINEAIRLNSNGEDTHLAIETSGHGALKENYFLDDGAYLIAKMLIKIAKLNQEGKTIDSLISDLGHPLESMEFRLGIKKEDFGGYGKYVLQKLFEYAGKQEGWDIAPDNHEGIRVSFGKGFGDGWFLLRLSLHDPLMPLNIESNSEGGIKNIAKNLSVFLSDYEGLDMSPIEKYLDSK